MKTMHSIKGLVHSFDSMTALDGYGLRALVFLHGCPLRCGFCANPETSWGDSKNPPEPMASSELLDMIARVKPYITGVSFSGGEPLAQPDFVADLMRGVHELGLTTCLDTSGAATRSGWGKVLDHTDHVLFCVKSFDPEMYAKITGRSQHRALEFAVELKDRRMPYNLRYVVVPGMTDRPSDIQKLVEFGKEQPTLKRVELLPYHKLGLEKWTQMGVVCPMRHQASPSHESVVGIAEQIRAHGIKVLL
jgi:pyruvate formate lyase activating enzyme